MAYDQGTNVKINEADTGPSAPIADLSWVTAVMETAEQSVPKKKLVLASRPTATNTR